MQEEGYVVLTDVLQSGDVKEALRLLLQDLKLLGTERRCQRVGPALGLSVSRTEGSRLNWEAGRRPPLKKKGRKQLNQGLVATRGARALAGCPSRECFGILAKLITSAPRQEPKMTAPRQNSCIYIYRTCIQLGCFDLCHLVQMRC